MSFKKIIFAIFFIVLLFMAGLFFAVPQLAAQTRDILIGIYAAAGLVLWGILSLTVYGLGKSAVKKVTGPKEKRAAPAKKTAPFDENAVQVFSILQRRGRLIDFLKEDIGVYEDSQIGAAVRNIHKGCKEAVEEYVKIEPVMREAEGDEVTVKEGFDPSGIRLTGNVKGKPPFKGILRHCGWRVLTTDFPPLPKKQDLRVLEPAEVEME